MKVRPSPLDYDCVSKTANYSTRWQEPEPIRLGHWESTDYSLLYTMKVRPSPLDYNCVFKTVNYSTRWHEPEPIRLGHWESTDYPLLYTMKVIPSQLDYSHCVFTDCHLFYIMTGTRARWIRTLNLYRIPSTLHNEGKAEPVGLWHWDSTDSLYSIRRQVSPNLWTITLRLYSKPATLSNEGKAEPVGLWQRNSTDTI